MVARRSRRAAAAQHDGVRPRRAGIAIQFEVAPTLYYRNNLLRARGTLNQTRALPNQTRALSEKTRALSKQTRALLNETRALFYHSGGATPH